MIEQTYGNSRAPLWLLDRFVVSLISLFRGRLHSLGNLLYIHTHTHTHKRVRAHMYTHKKLTISCWTRETLNVTRKINSFALGVI